MTVFTTYATNDPANISLIETWASDDDRAQAAGKTNANRAHEFLLARAAQKSLLAQVTGDNHWHIRPDARGKPYAFTANGQTGPHISLSHTKGLIACAVSLDAPIGIDVEQWRPRDFTAIAAYAFGDQERAEVTREGAAAFYRIWTLKEAIAKLTGKGIMAHINGKDQAASAPTDTYWLTDQYRLFYTSPKAGYSLALAEQKTAIG